VKNSHRIAVAVAAILITAIQALAQLPKDPEERAKVVAQIMQANARQLTLFDRDGKELNSFGKRDLYGNPVFSPDSKRMAVVKGDLEKESNDIWIVDIATGKEQRITVSGERERAGNPVWSPDGKNVAYLGLRQGAFGLYVKPSNGEGTEELLYKSATPVNVTDWSMDGKYLTFFASDLGGASIFAMPVTGSGERKPIEIYHSAKPLGGGRLSPDDKYVVYVAEEGGKTDLYVRPFNPSAAAGAAASAGPWKISEQGTLGMPFWRRDGKELTFLASDRSVMAVTLTTSPDFEFSKPKVLFRLPDSTPIAPGIASVNREADRFVVAVPPPALRQLTMLDRQGKVVGTVGQPGLFGGVQVSPDGKRLLVMQTDTKTALGNLWVYDIATGKTTPITTETQTNIQTMQPVWSADGKYVAYVQFKDKFSHIYRRAADGTGEPELLFRYTPGAFVGLTDWSRDGKFMAFTTGVMLIVPVTSAEKPLDRKALEWLREDYDAFEGKFSPDGRFLAYFSNEADVLKTQVYVRPFDPSKPGTPAGPGVQVSNVKGGVGGGIFWRKDGKEMYFMNIDREVLAVDITTSPKVQAGTPKALFKLDPLVGGGAVFPDGDRFVVAMPVK
jgi:Tol biopolymer transport system component